MAKGPSFCLAGQISYIEILKGLDTLGIFSGIFFKGDNFHDFLFAFLHSKPLLKGVYSKKEEFALIGSRFFRLRVDLFTRKEIRF